MRWVRQAIETSLCDDEAGCGIISVRAERRSCEKKGNEKSNDKEFLMSDESMSLPGRFAVYGTVAGKPTVVARFEDNDVWLTQKQLADLFNTTKQLVSHHIRQIIESGELAQNRTVKKYLTVQTGGARSRVGGRADN